MFGQLFSMRDFSVAMGFHLIIVAAILWLNQWHNAPKPIKERTIQVKMVSLQDLQEMMAKPKLEPAIATPPPAKLLPPPPPPPKPEVKPEIKPKPALPPVAKPTPKKVEPKKVTPKKVTPKKVEPKKLEPNYDPFAPLESKGETPRKAKVSGEKELNKMLTAQLSDEAINHYILGMQKAVERQWKVPTEMINRVNDALVELTLFPNGKVAKVHILESSGSTLLDQTLLQAIYAAAPFDVPKQQFELFKHNVIRFYPLR